MKEIKFRMWSKKYQQMFGMTQLMAMYTVGAKLAKQYVPGVSDSEVDMPLTGVSLPFQDDAILMQFIGLKDKNGKEIYEGDVLECCEPYNDIERAVIRFNEKSAKFVFDMYYDGEAEITETLDADNWIGVNHFEIIGNIYENHKLEGGGCI